MKFRKKPVVIEAVQIEKGLLDTAPEWLWEAANTGVISLAGINSFTRDEPWAEINTLEGIMRGEKGDWIIRGVKGELYPCKPDIFEATYEPVEDSHD